MAFIARSPLLSLPSTSAPLQGLVRGFSALSVGSSQSSGSKYEPNFNRNSNRDFVTSTVNNAIKGRWTDIPEISPASKIPVRKYSSPRKPLDGAWSDRMNFDNFEPTQDEDDAGSSDAFSKNKNEREKRPDDPSESRRLMGALPPHKTKMMWRETILNPPLYKPPAPAATEQTGLTEKTSALMDLYPDVQLDREAAKPILWEPPAPPEPAKRYGTVIGPRKTTIANFSLYKISIDYAQAPFYYSDRLSREEKDIYHAHMSAVQKRQLSYTDPTTKYQVMTVCQLILNGKCCGNGCRHCPWHMSNAPPEIKRSKVWNGAFYVTCRSIHRSRAPSYGIHRHTKVRCIDNSKIGKEAMLTGRPPYCIWVYKKKSQYSKRHMPKAQLGDKILVAVKGEMKKAYVVGFNFHRADITHGVPCMDTNNVVLVDDKGNPLGTRILGPIPGTLRGHPDGNFTKILSIATKFV